MNTTDPGPALLRFFMNTDDPGPALLRFFINTADTWTSSAQVLYEHC